MNYRGKYANSYYFIALFSVIYILGGYFTNIADKILILLISKVLFIVRDM